MLKQLAQDLLAGRLSLDDFLRRCSHAGFADLGEAKVDLARPSRCGFPEVVFAEGKSIESLEKICQALADHGSDVLATRVSPEQAQSLAARFPSGQYHTIGRTFRIPCEQPTTEPPARVGRVAVVTAGTSDLPVAEEARQTALWTGAQVDLIEDVGVAGPHRLAANLPLLRQADAVVVVAGMEGALPSVVGGHVAVPVIGVPTSVGYGASFGGIAALLAMLNSCAANVTVVNIDAGFKGGYLAGLIARNAVGGRQ
ncbi:MAG TPA: nickel pincer cofactor biosynthesis protein LarB [Thermoguttaceae bacterium]|nr:nickel pincer cofactor biosynthesis protein LarB [Thermoguttaceae bacterium]